MKNTIEDSEVMDLIKLIIVAGFIFVIEAIVTITFIDWSSFLDQTIKLAIIGPLGVALGRIMFWCSTYSVNTLKNKLFNIKKNNLKKLHNYHIEDLERFTEDGIDLNGTMKNEFFHEIDREVCIPKRLNIRPKLFNKIIV
ncbi:hypothetical protein GW796_10855 [archaeon]|nr:hypothetical protein [archaeon]